MSGERCSKGGLHCKGDYFDSVKTYRTTAEVRREAGVRMNRGQLCAAHASELGALVPVPSDRRTKIA